MLSKIIFTNISEVHLGTCTCAFVITCQRISWTVCIFYLVFGSASLIRFGWRGGCSSHKVYICHLVWLASNHKWGFCFTRCVVQHLGLLEKSRWLLSIIEGFLFDCLWPALLEEATKLSEKLLTIFVLDVKFIVSNILGNLRSCFQVVVHPTTSLW